MAPLFCFDVIVLGAKLLQPETTRIDPRAGIVWTANVGVALPRKEGQHWPD